ncbi:glycosyltransferase [Wenyingzhuangia marina]|uniref:Glycosyl transferase family 2 n=1 Tax=Wenyingzhuangia marina TaxID=1195760 RepID=A0A1M5UA17_9FLAO|nr:glycosyltransferase [Wenyingzhuangia marina]GGF68792.1 hypothetical protein GCM10011397_09720 [Wenyingzhuangia marina]SHH59758.1 Glycosyl transferase family 2 [Wenyingzhuangia marina]
MRLGENPQRNQKLNTNNYSHRVIMPIYIPNQDEYYADSFKILKRSIQSLVNTISKQSAITIVNNGCCKEVVDYLNELFKEDKIQDLIHTQKIGKLNSIIKAVKSSYEPLITITDSDVLFLSGWLNKTVEVYKNFPKAGVVGIVPQFKQFENLGYNVIYNNLFNANIKFTEVKNPKALKLFYKSIGWKDDYNKDYLKYNLTITSKSNSKVKAIIGSGHFVATYKRELFNNDIAFSDYLLGGNSEIDLLDLPCVKKGLWRLTTDGNYAYHMGNVLEFWMNEETSLIPEEINFEFLKNDKKVLKNKDIGFLFNTKLMRVFYKKYKSIFYKKWGLPKKLHSTY